MEIHSYSLHIERPIFLLPTGTNAAIGFYEGRLMEWGLSVGLLEGIGGELNDIHS